MRKFTSRKKQGIVVLICSLLCTACLGNIPATALTAHASGMEYLPNGEPAGQDVTEQEIVIQPDNVYLPLVDKTGEYELDSYDETDLFVTLTGALPMYLGGTSLEQYYATKIETDPEFFLMEDGTDCYKQLEDLTAGREYTAVTEQIRACLMQLSGLITGTEDNWPVLCYFSQYRISRESAEVCSATGGAIVDIATTPLYIDLSRSLTYACHGYSLKNYYNNMKEIHPEYFGTEDEDYYAKLVELAGEDGLCPVTEEIKSTLINLAKTFLQDETGESWWRFCFYYRDKLTQREEFTFDTRLIYGNAALADEDAFLVVMTGNGFDTTEAVKYMAEASTLLHTLVDETIYGECKDSIKIYFLNSDGTQGKKKLKRFMKRNPAADYGIVLDNSMEYKESREGNLFICTLNSGSRKLLKQDLSRTLTGWTENGFLYSDQEITQSWYHTGQQCLMQSAEAGDFCEFCKEEIRRGISQHSNVTMLYYQPAGKLLLEGCEPEDLLSCIRVRKNGFCIVADQSPALFGLIYYDQGGAVADSLQTAVSGTYKMDVAFTGSGIFDPVSITTTYHVDVIFHYDPQGGSPVADTYETVGEKVGASLPETTREGYTFKGWYTAPEGGEKVDESTVVTSGTTLYAHWLKNYNVTFNANGSGVSLSETSVTVTSGEKIGTLPKATRRGYVFKGWYTAKTGGKKISSGTAITKRTTFFARWSKVTVAKVSNVKLTAAPKAVKTSYKRINGVEGYEIRYSTSKTMSKYKTLTVKGTVRTLNNLTSKRIYYVKVRAYKLDSLGKKVYGAWSTKKACKAK